MYTKLSLHFTAWRHIASHSYHHRTTTIYHLCVLPNIIWYEKYTYTKHTRRHIYVLIWSVVICGVGYMVWFCNASFILICILYRKYLSYLYVLAVYTIRGSTQESCCVYVCLLYSQLSQPASTRWYFTKPMCKSNLFLARAFA